MTASQPSVAIGVDIGGTKVTTAAVDSEINIIAEKTEPTQCQSAEGLVKQVVGLINDLLVCSELSSVEVVGVGLGVAGLVDFKQGLVYYCPNLSLENVALKSRLEQKVALPVFVDNDANLATLAEMLHGAGRGVANFVCLTIGTGIGGGLVIEGKLYRGSRNLAGEIGHTIVEPQGARCGCGQRGCLEAMASGQALVRLAREKFSQNKASLVFQEVEGRLESINGEIVIEAARQGDKLANQVLGEIGSYLGQGLASVINLLDPELIIVGGGLVVAGKLILGPARRVVAEKILPRGKREVPIVSAKLGPKAGLIGAATLVFSQGED